MKLIALCFALLIAGCVERHSSAIMTEPATVVDLLYVPSGHGDGTGISSKGSVVFTSMDIPARYGVVFECQHGRFAVEGREELWKRMHVGEHVTVSYTEEYEVDGKTQRLVGLRFVDAKP